jgi:hypothetical protein
MTLIERVDPEWAWSEFSPSRSTPWDRQLAAHLHRRSGFGATAEQLDDSLKRSPQEVVASICAAAQEPADATQYDALVQSVLAGGDPQGLGAAWAYRMLTTSAQLREKMTLFWHGHFATSAEKVEDVHLMHNQNELLRTHALGDFAAILRGISKDPAMLIYLDSVTNRKAHPNENFAREVMELFCLGEGNYSEQDVVQLARCFTGWEIKRGKYRFNKYQHDFGEKSIFGKKGEFSGEDGVDLVLKHPAGPVFIAQKLVKFFVMDEPSPDAELVAPLAKQIRADDWNVGPTVKRILGSNLFFSEHALAAKVRSPIEFVLGLLRCLHGSTNANRIASGCRELGQGLFFPPNVKGWDGGRAWINSSTLLGRANLMKQILADSKTRFAGGSIDTLLERYDISDGEPMVRWLTELLIAPSLPKAVISQLVAEAQQAKGDRAKRVVFLIASLPESQLA